MRKIKGKKLNWQKLEDISVNYKRAGYNKPKWMQFAQDCISTGYDVYMYEAQKTVSKYITVVNGDKRYLVRFSNHAPNYRREVNGDCDFFVGRTNLGVTNTQLALETTLLYLGAPKNTACVPPGTFVEFNNTDCYYMGNDGLRVLKPATIDHVELAVNMDDLPWD